MRKTAPGLRSLLFAALLGAKSGAQAASRYLCDVYGATEGLPENTVASVARITDGYLWVATQGGLARFDGLRFQAFHMLDSPGLPDDNIHYVAGSRDGSLWVGTYNRGAAHLVNGRFEPVAGLLSPVIRAILEDREGAIWIATRGGLNRWNDGTLSAYTKKDGLPAGDVLALTEDRKGRIWIGLSGGVAVLERGKFVDFPAQARLAGMDVRSFALSNDGSLWAASSQAFARLKDGVIQEWYGREEKLPFKAEIRSIAEGADGALWIGTFGDGLLRLQEAGSKTSDWSRGWPAPSDFLLRSESDGSLWIGTSGGGLNRLRPRQIRMIGAPRVSPPRTPARFWNARRRIMDRHDRSGPESLPGWTHPDIYHCRWPEQRRGAVVVAERRHRQAVGRDGRWRSKLVGRPAVPPDLRQVRNADRRFGRYQNITGVLDIGDQTQIRPGLLFAQRLFPGTHFAGIGSPQRRSRPVPVPAHFAAPGSRVRRDPAYTEAALSASLTMRGASAALQL